MERKQLKVLVFDETKSQTGVGSTGNTLTRVTDFDIDQRAEEVLYLKRAALWLSLDVPTAGYACFMASRILRSSLVKDLENAQKLILALNVADSDSYSELSVRNLGTQQGAMWNWEAGFEPVFLDCPYVSNVLTVVLNAGAFNARFYWVFDYWIERPGSAEYEKLRLKNGPLG